jgi:hypothetical protein
MLHHLIHFLESHMAPCFYMKYFGIPCPGCGMQRALIELLKGNLVESLRLYPALLPIIAMLSLLILHLVFKLKNGAAWLKYLFFINVGIIFFNYLYTILTSNY